MLTKQPAREVRKAMRQVLGAFRLNWKLFLGIHVIVNVFSLLVLTPLLTVVLGWLVLASGETALTDEDILFFVLSPTGMLAMLISGALYTTVVVFQQAAMITAAFAVTSGHRITIPWLARYVLMKSWPLFRLATQMVGRTVLIAAPFLLLAAWIFLSFLTEFDINYYIAKKPPIFWWAGSTIILSLLALLAVLLRVFSAWVLALPMLLIKNESPRHVLSQSRKASISMRVPIALTLLCLFLLNALLLGLVTSIADLAVDGVVAMAGESLKVMAYLLGGLLIAWLSANVAITFFSNSVLSLVIIHMYTRLIADSGSWNLDGSKLSSTSSGIWRNTGVK
ncbi:MAG: hypothetical protein GQ538_12105 [Xanthomonadales bacterium]|nr:hypothetical protein [Xanthomonadales bacterium]